MNWRLRLKEYQFGRTQWLLSDRLLDWQRRRLRPVVAHAATHSPYYRRTFANHGVAAAKVRGLDDLQLLPILSRQDAIEHGSEIVATTAERFHPQWAATGGTTGAPLALLLDRETSMACAAATRRFHAWYGIRLGDRVAEFRRGNSFRLPSGELDQITVSRFVRRRDILRFNLAAVDADRMAVIVEQLLQFRPKAIRGVPSFLTLISLYLLEKKERRIRPRVVFAGGERLFPDQRQTLAEAFASPVVETYGNNECVMAAVECEQGSLHLAAELGIVEILKHGRAAAPGEIGDIVVSSLWNRSFPLIRYAIGDVGYLEREPCSCGRGLPTWRVLGGKTLNLLATPRGHFFISNSLMAQARWHGKIAAIRYYQETRDAVTVQIVPGPALSGEDRARLEGELRQTFNGLLRVAFAYYDSIEQTPGGKYRYVVSKVPLEL